MLEVGTDAASLILLSNMSVGFDHREVNLFFLQSRLLRLLVCLLD